MVPQKNGVQCKANEVIVDALKIMAQGFQETQKDRLAATVRRAIRSISEWLFGTCLTRRCSTPIRCRQDALKLRGIGDFMARKIEDVLVKADQGAMCKQRRIVMRRYGGSRIREVDSISSKRAIGLRSSRGRMYLDLSLVNHSCTSVSTRLGPGSRGVCRPNCRAVCC